MRIQLIVLSEWKFDRKPITGRDLRIKDVFKVTHLI